MRVSAFDPRPFVPRLLHERRATDDRAWTVDGTIVMADVTGFTALSDRLARHGRLGAEELTATLNRIFTVLLAASDDGGDVLKFGGDALLVLYTGPNHASRACHSALAMQRVLRAVGRVQLTGAKTTLRMSVGINSGPIDLMIVGSRPAELFVLGPTVQGVLGYEARAGAGEVLVSPATAALTDGHTFDAEVDGALKLRRGTPLAPAAALFSQREAQQDVSRFLTASLGERPDLIMGDGEHRRVAVGFLTLVGLDALPPGLDERRGILESAVATVEAACDEYSITPLGSDIWPGGIKMLLAAGVPDAGEEPEADLLRCLTQIAQADAGVTIKAGVASGPVFAGSLGALFRRTFTLMGDTVNLAARLAGQAGPGEVLTTRTVVERTRHDVETGPPKMLTLKGKPEPIEALPILGVGTAAAGDLGADVPLVGRIDEMAVLRAALEAGASAIELTGEAGIGKTRLAVEALAGRDHVLVRSTRYDVDEPLLTLRYVLRDLLRIDRDQDAATAGETLRRIVDDKAPRLARWLPLIALAVGADADPTPEVDDLDPYFRRARMHVMVGRLLRAVRPEGFLVLLDDAHWVDDSSADALTTILAEGASQPWTIVSTRRPDGRGLRFAAERATLVTVGALSIEESRSLAHAAADSDRLDVAIDRAVQRSSGNPLFLIELVRAGVDATDLPASMDALVASRIDALDRDGRDAFRVASVLGPRFHRDLYAAVAIRSGVPDPDVIEDLAAFLALEGDEYAFRREAYREVAYAQLSYRRRREIHQRAGHELEAGVGGATAGALARHFFEARDWARAWQHARTAAVDAAARFAHDEAVLFFGWAAESGRRANVEAELLADLHQARGDSAEQAAHYDVAEAAYAAARTWRQDPIGQVRLVERSGQLHERTGRYSSALAAYTRARRMLAAAGETSPDAVELGIELDLATAGVRYRQGHWRDCIRWCEQAMSKAEAAGADHLVGHAQYLYDTAIVEIDGPTAVRYGEMPMRAFEARNDLVRQSRCLNNLGVQAYFRGEWTASATFYERGCDASQRAGDVVGAATTTNNLGEIRSDQGRHEEALAYFTDARRTFTAADYPVGLALTVSNLGRLARRQGDFERARETLADAVAAFRQIGAAAFFVEAEARVLELDLARGAADSVAQRSRRLLGNPALVGATAPVHAQLHRLAGLAEWAAGDAPLARTSLAESLLLARSIGALYEEALTCAALAEIGVDPGKHWSLAAAAFEKMAVTVVDLPSMPHVSLPASALTALTDVR